MERDFLNKKPNPVEHRIWMSLTLSQYLHKDLIFDTGDLNVKFNIETVEDIIENQMFTLWIIPKGLMCILMWAL